MTNKEIKAEIKYIIKFIGTARIQRAKSDKEFKEDTTKMELTISKWAKDLKISNKRFQKEVKELIKEKILESVTKKDDDENMLVLKLTDKHFNKLHNKPAWN